MLLRTIEEVKQYGTPNLSLSMLSLAPYIADAEERNVVPFIGQAMYDRLNAAYDGPQDIEAELITRLQRAIAPLALAAYIAENEVNISDSGITRTENETTKTAYNNQIVRLRRSLQDRGLAALDKALESIQNNKSNWDEWTTNEQFALYNSLLVRNGNMMNTYFRNPRPQQLYAACASVMETIERLFIMPDFGESFTALKAKQQANAMAVEEKVLAATLGKAITYLTIFKGANELQLRMDDAGLTVLAPGTDAAQDEQSKRTAATGNAVSALQRQCESIGLEYIDAAKQYLNTKASATLFVEWHTRLQDASPFTPTDINTNLDSIYSL